MLKGSLEEFELSDIFRLLSFTKKTGRLGIERAAGSGTVYFKGGHVYFAESTLAREPLGQKLIRAGLLTERELMDALDEHAESGRRVGEILVERGVITQEQLEAAIKAQIEDATFVLLRWERGKFEFERTEDVVVEIPISISVDNLIMEASRRLDELATISRKIPSADTVLRVTPVPPEGAREISITPEEWRLLVLVDGTRSVREIASQGKMDEFAAMKILYGLIAAGLVETDPAAAVAPEVATPAETSAHADVFGPRAHDAPESFGTVTAVDLPAPADVESPASPEVLGGHEREIGEGEIARDFAVVAAHDEQDSGGDEPLVAAVDLGSFGPEPPPVEDVAASVTEWVPFAGHEAGQEDEYARGSDAAAPPEEAGAVPERETNGSDDASFYLQSFLDDQEFAAAAPPAPPRSPAEPQPAPSVDRAAVVRELAGLFNEDQPRGERTPEPSHADRPRRLEDDDQLNKGLIHRLIDGVKGL